MPMTNREGAAFANELVAKATVELEARIDEIEQRLVAKRQVRKDALEASARQLIELHKRLVDVEIDRGLRRARPIAKAGASLAEQLRAIVAEEGSYGVRKNGGPVSWKGFLD